MDGDSFFLGRRTYAYCTPYPGTVPTPYGIIRPTPTPSACACRLRCGGGGGGKSRSLESCAAPLQAGVFVIQYYLVKLSTDTGWERGNSVLVWPRAVGVAVDASHLRSVQCAAH